MATANPFDVLPPNLFNPFGTQGTTLQRHYMAIMLRLYGLVQVIDIPLEELFERLKEGKVIAEEYNIGRNRL